MPLAWILAAPVAIASTGFFLYQFLLGPRPPAGPVGDGPAPVTARPGEEVRPSLSPDGRSVVYASREGGDWDLLLQPVGGGAAINLTEDNPLDDSEPAFSPDGGRIAFRSERQNGGLFVMGATGGSVRRVTGAGHLPAWSPDGGKIAYSTSGFSNPLLRQPASEIHVVDLASGESRRIAGPDATQPSWSPNGHRIAYWGLGGASGRRDIWTVPAAGGEPVPVTDDDATDWSPTWSPDGEFLLFSSDRGGTMDLWRIPIDERSGRVLGPAQPDPGTM